MISNSEKPIIVFDGICNLCNATIKLIISLDKNDVFRYLSFQSEKAKELMPDYDENIKHMDTVILIYNNMIFVKSEAALFIAKLMGYPWKFFYFLRFIPKFIRDWAYEKIAYNRYQWFGKKAACMIPSKDIKYKFLDN